MASTKSQNASSSVSCLTPASDSETLRLPWDVFLSFRGPDTRAKFVSHLYQRLDASGIRTFWDKPELPTGEVISEALIEAIQGSRIYVVVFSENYASSSWCLDELVEIYNCCENMNRSVIGVYYHIDPSVVRRQTNSFEKAFEKHQTRFANKVDKWRGVLLKVADISGIHVTAGRDESDIINEIVDVILWEIKPKTLHVADYPVGLESRVEDIMTSLSSGTEGVIKFGIYGMGGIGKTTLAKALFNKLLERRFKCSCFLAEVRETAGRENGLVFLQQQLIDEFLKSKKKVEIHNVEEGTKFIREIICSAKVMVLIDDIYDFKQYKYLVPGTFAPGSVVIVTTRDEGMLDKIGVVRSHRYNVHGLNDAESLDLFTQHAFGNAKPDNTLMVLFEDILLLSGRLPLALEVFGSYLLTKSEEGWKAYIKRLQRNLNSDIQEKLIISLDALESDDPMLKKMFLDIACFFIGRKKKEVVKIMETYYEAVDYNFDVLKQRCLLTFNNGDELGMHDLLRDMGRQVAQNKFPDDVGKHSRLWVPKDIRTVLGKRKGTEEIEGIIPSNFYYHDDALQGETFTTKTFKRMTRLRFLYLENVKLSGSFKEIFENLRWLHWDGCPLERLPSNFCPPELVILALPSSKMTMWELNMGPQVFEKLTTLDMSYSLGLTVTPNFYKLPCLKVLDLKGCKSLEEVDISIGFLTRLLSINISGCVNLRSLPDTICNLTTLNSLNIGGCSSLKALPKDLGNIDSLTELNAWGLTVSEIPDSIGHLRKLVVLNLSDNGNLEAPFSSASNMTPRTPTHWEAFLSFRGSDTRHTFTNYLYAALDRYGVRTFEEDPMLRSGEVIPDALVQAIHNSKTYIVVLSENSASSSWCLDELVEILNCCKTIGRLVIPVFYNIDPSVVRNQTGGFKEALEKHQILRKVKMEKVNKWRMVLTELSKISGYQISEYGHISETISQVIRVLSEINPRPLSVAKYPVRLDYRVLGWIIMLKA